MRSLEEIISIIQGSIAGTLYAQINNGVLETISVNNIVATYTKEEIQLAAFQHLSRQGNGLPITDSLIRIAQFVLLYGYGHYDVSLTSNSDGIVTIWINERISGYVEIKTIWAGGGSLWKDSLYAYIFPKRD